MARDDLGPCSRCGLCPPGNTSRSTGPRQAASIRSSCSSVPYGSSAPWISSVGRRHPRGLGLEVPGAERGIEPDVAPAPERGIGIVVVARHPLAQGAARGTASRVPRIASHGDPLDEHVRREQDQPADRVVRRRGSARSTHRRCARRAPARRRRVAREQLRQHLERLLVEERRRPRLGGRRRAPVPVARERDQPPPVARAASAGKLAPQVRPSRAPRAAGRAAAGRDHREDRASPEAGHRSEPPPAAGALTTAGAARRSGPRPGRTAAAGRRGTRETTATRARRDGGNARRRGRCPR